MIVLVNSDTAPSSLWMKLKVIILSMIQNKELVINPEKKSDKIIPVQRKKDRNKNFAPVSWESSARSVCLASTFHLYSSV